MVPYQQSIEEVAKKTVTDLKTGLSPEQVLAHQKSFGVNSLPQAPSESIFIIFLRQFQSPLIYILLIAALLIYITGRALDAFIISGILLFNSIIGTIQEGRARNILESLKKFITSEAIVIRNGKKEVIPDYEVTIGDLIILQEGQKVPADARIIQAQMLQIDEALLTGESQAVFKNSSPIHSPASLGDQKNMVFKGTYILSGTGQAIVTAIGLQTEIGKIGKEVEAIDEDLPLKRKLDRLANWILLFIALQTILLFIIGYFSGKPVLELITALVALFICSIPEGLPVVLTLGLVAGARNMAKKQVLVKRLQAVEGLGLADTIIIDKTGTLTRNELMVSSIFADDRYFSISGRGYFIEGAITPKEKQDHLKPLALASTLLNTAQIHFDKKEQRFQVTGDPTDAALSIFAQKMGFTEADVLKNYEIMYQLPFNDKEKLKAVFVKHDTTITAFIHGAPETLCTRSVCLPATEQALTALVKKGLRVIGAAKKDFALDEIDFSKNSLDYYLGLLTGLEFLGLYGIQDAIRSEVPAIVNQARQAGLHIVMATGDHKETALFVAEHVGIYRSGDRCITGAELEKLSDSELVEALDHATVFSRVSPRQKVRLVNAFHQRNDVVAMTGDGVNDVPSLAAADLGIAMGSIGTEVAKKAADMILLNDSFASIIDAIKEGRHIFFTLRRVILYFFTTNFGEVLIVFAALIAGLPLPLTAAQILWLNFVTDGFLDVSLVAESHENDLLIRNIESTDQLIDKSIIIKIVYMSLPMMIGSLGIFLFYYQTDLKLARTMTLLTMAMFQWFNVWNCRSETKSVFEIGIFSNKWLIAATTFVFLLQLCIIYLPFMHYIFDTVPLSLTQWLLVLVITSSILVVEEARVLLSKQFSS